MNAADVTVYIGELLGSFALGLSSGWLLLYFKKATGFIK